MNKVNIFGIKKSGDGDDTNRYYFIKAVRLQDAWRKLAQKLTKSIRQTKLRHHLRYKNLSKDHVQRIKCTELIFIN